VSGIEVLRRIKEHPVLRSLPVVAFTSSREGPDVEACYALGVNSYLVKPLAYADFSDVLRQAGVYWGTLNEPPVITGES
jgi:two-component system response regulator